MASNDLWQPVKRKRIELDPALGLRELPSQALGSSVPKHKIVASCEPADIADLFEDDVEGVAPEVFHDPMYLFYVWASYNGDRDHELERLVRTMGGEFDFGCNGLDVDNIVIFKFHYKSQAMQFISRLKEMGSKTKRIVEIEVFIGDPANTKAQGAPVPEYDWWGGGWTLDQSDGTWFDSAHTGIMGSLVESILHEMPMKGPWYRGTRRAKEQGRLKLRSYTSSPEIASIYAAQPGDMWATNKAHRNAHYVPGSSVHRYDELPIDNPIDLAEGPIITMKEFLQKMHWGEDCEDCEGIGTYEDGETCERCQGEGQVGIRHAEVCDLMNYLIKRYNGHLKMTEFLWRYVDDEGEEAEEQIWSLDPPMVHCGLDEWLDEWDMDVSSEDDPYAFDLGYRLAVDAYALIDWPGFVDVAKRIGYDGVIHHDVMDGAHASQDVLGIDPEDIEGLEDGEYWGGWWDDYGDEMDASWVHDTVRPFN